MLKTSIMKSILKIATQTRGNHLIPIIKIIQPVDYVNPGIGLDMDERDKLISNFLQNPIKAGKNYLFEVCSHHNIPMDDPTAKIHITTIAPVEEEQILYKFRHAILNRFVPYNSIYKLNCMENFDEILDPLNVAETPKGFVAYQKIHAFFDWLEQTERSTWEEQNPI